MIRSSAIAAAIALAACAPPGAGRLRFKNEPPVWTVDDRRNTPDKPKETPWYKAVQVADSMVIRRSTHALEVHAPTRARDTNSLGEVPDSTWFTNRIGRGDLTAADIARGPNTTGPVLPLTIKKSKTKGKAPGFIAKDATGTTYIVKFDMRGNPVIETATDIVVQRLLWACGYNVPEDYIVVFRRDQLELTAKSTAEDATGNKRRMTPGDLDDVLAKAHRFEDGTYRAVASKYLPGIPVGGFRQEGTRADDPNDVIPHEDRRVVRGLYVFFSWVQYTDVKLSNTLDMWTEDPARPGHHYVVHYLVDFGKSLGAFATLAQRPGDGHVENVDWRYDVLSFFTFGLWKRPWEGTPDPGIEGVAPFDAEHFHPGEWTPHWLWVPFLHADVYDMFWAAKIVMRFTPAQIRAAVRAGQYRDPRAVDYLTDVLIERQRKIGRYWFARVSPLDRFRVSGRADSWQLCFDDLVAAYDLDPAATARTRYVATAFDFDGDPLPWQISTVDTCVGELRPPGHHDGYTIVRIAVERGDDALPPVDVHLQAEVGTGAPRVIGINRH